MAIPPAATDCSLPPFPRIDAGTKSGLAYEILRDSIMRGVLRPGQRLKSAELAEQLGVSMIPVREALKHLMADGLVSNIAHVGATVSALPLQELREIIPVRATLEGLAARMVAERADEQGLARIEACVRDARAQSQLVEPHALWLLNLEFHRQVCLEAGNAVLSRLTDSVCEKTNRFRMVYGMLPPRGLSDLREHQQIMELFEQGDGTAAEAAMREHLETSLREVVEHLAGLSPQF